MTRTLVQAFFYDLLRDALPAGEAERLLREHEKLAASGNSVAYSNPHLANYALELADRFLKASGDPPPEENNTVAREVLTMLHLYPHYNLESRHNGGCLSRILRAVAPDIQHALSEGEDPGDLLDRFFPEN